MTSHPTIPDPRESTTTTEATDSPFRRTARIRQSDAADRFVIPSDLEEKARDGITQALEKYHLQQLDKDSELFGTLVLSQNTVNAYEKHVNRTCFYLLVY